MPDLQAIIGEINAVGTGFDVVRRKYIRQLAQFTKRNVIVYYSAWLQKPIPQLAPHLQVNDNDKNGFMATIHQLDRSKGLDLVLHTPGGDAAATESLVHYLREMFGTNIRAIIPQLAMSAGTMISLSCKEILMGKHSNLGPIDPQIMGLPAHAIIDEFDRARDEIQKSNDLKEQQANIALWQPIIAKYTPTLIGQCQHAINWSTDMVTEWLKTGMFTADNHGDDKAQRIVKELGSHALTKTHSRHIHLQRLQKLGVAVTALEDHQDLQDAVLSVHHACTQTFNHTGVLKIIENQDGISFIMAAQLSPQANAPAQ